MLPLLVKVVAEDDTCGCDAWRVAPPYESDDRRAAVRGVDGVHLTGVRRSDDGEATAEIDVSPSFGQSPRTAAGDAQAIGRVRAAGVQRDRRSAAVSRRRARRADHALRAAR